MKRHSLWICAVAAALLTALIARPVLALWIQFTLPKNGVYNEQEFKIKTKTVENFMQFEVSIAPHPHPVSPFLTGQLALIAQDKWVASVPVSEKRENGTVTYTFRVVPDAIAQSTFELHASAYAPVYSANGVFGTAMLGKQKVEQVMGGTIYKLKLKDFADIKQSHKELSAP